MNDRMLIDLNDVIDVGRGTDETLGQVMQALSDLADEINSALPDYECTLVHLDTRDYLAFVPTDDQAERERAFDELVGPEPMSDQRAQAAFREMQRQEALREMTDAYLEAQQEAALCFGYVKIGRPGDVGEGDGCASCNQPMLGPVWVALMGDGQALGPLCDLCATSE